MDVVERYARAVGAYLPQTQRRDIIAELADDVRGEIDDRQAETGCALTEAEIEAMLVKRGPPLRVATHYLPQRWLIGPALLPIYFLVLKIALAVQIGVFLLVLTPVRVFQGASVVEALVQSAANLLVTIWIPIGVVTVIFAAVERSQMETPWSPRRLPSTRDSGGASGIPRSGAIAQVALGGVFVLWWLASAPLPVTITAPLWHTLTHDAYVPVLAVSLGSLALATANVLRPYWTPLRLGLRAALDGLAAALALVVLIADWSHVGDAFTVMANAGASGVAKINAWADLNVALVLIAVVIVGAASGARYALDSARLFVKSAQSIRP